MEVDYGWFKKSKEQVESGYKHHMVWGDGRIGRATQIVE